MKMTKKKVFMISLVGTGLCLLLGGNTKMLVFWCGARDFSCQDNLNYFICYLVLFIPILLFSIVTYFLKEDVFKPWLKFTYWYYPIYILVILLLSGMGGGGGYLIGNVFDSNFFALSQSVIYAIISSFIVILLFPLKDSKKKRN
jgi:hypothetical protein